MITKLSETSMVMMIMTMLLSMRMVPDLLTTQMILVDCIQFITGTDATRLPDFVDDGGSKNNVDLCNI